MAKLTGGRGRHPTAAAGLSTNLPDTVSVPGGWLVLQAELVLALALGHPESLAPTADVGGVGRAMRSPACRRMVMPGPARGEIDLELNGAAQAFACDAAGSRQAIRSRPGSRCATCRAASSMPCSPRSCCRASSRVRGDHDLITALARHGFVVVAPFHPAPKGRCTTAPFKSARHSMRLSLRASDNSGGGPVGSGRPALAGDGRSW